MLSACLITLSPAAYAAATEKAITIRMIVAAVHCAALHRACAVDHQPVRQFFHLHAPGPQIQRHAL